MAPNGRGKRGKGLANMSSDLADRQCVPCRGGVPALTHEQIQPLVAQLDGWTVEGDKRLIKTFKVANFLEAMAFANAITPVAEAQGHHPDLYVAWGKLTVYI